MKRNSRSGFTLMEIMAVVVLIGILTTVLVRFGPRVICRIQKKTAESQLTTIKDVIGTYHLENGEYPTDLQQLRPDFYEGKLEDPWKKEIEFRVIDEGQGLFELRSGGCDKRLNTADDVVVDSSLPD